MSGEGARKRGYFAKLARDLESPKQVRRFGSGWFAGATILLSIGQGDLPVVQSLVFIFAALTVLFNLIADILYGFLDPRIRYD